MKRRFDSIKSNVHRYHTDITPRVQKKEFKMNYETISQCKVNLDEIMNIAEYSCTKPNFRDQRFIDYPTVEKLDNNNNFIILAHNVLNKDELTSYITSAATVERYTGRSAFGSFKPRREVCYSVDGQPYKYSNINHQTKKYPLHILDIIPTLKAAVFNIDHSSAQNLPSLENCEFNELSNGIDILYSNEFLYGGSNGTHSDNELPFGLVIIYSLGQSRILRIRRKSDKVWYNVEMKHNSVVAMYGSTFQELYTHQVDKLPPHANIYPRLSLNIRFLKGNDNMESASSSII